MKILFIRNAGRFSGSETYDINLFSELAKHKKYKIYFLTNLRGFARRASRLGVAAKIIFWGEEGIGTKKQLLSTLVKLPFVLPRYIYLIHKLEKKGRFDIICLQSMTEKLFLTPLLKVQGYKVIWTELGPIYATRMSEIITWLYKIVSIFVDKIITISKDTKNDLIHGGVSSKKIMAVYIGIDTKLFKPLSVSETKILRNRHHIPLNATVIGFLGTVTEEKGIEEFVEVSNALIKQNRNCYFVVIGDGPRLNWMKAIVKTLQINHSYLFLGFLDNVKKYLGSIDILLLPTHHFEGLSLAILEAQSMGKVVIASSMGGNLEIINNGINGYVYKKFNITNMVRLIDSLSIRRSKILKLSNNARKNIIDKFNIQLQAEKFLFLISAL